jgi:cobalt-zinc-cadmium efflux system outer membrane protein
VSRQIKAALGILLTFASANAVGAGVQEVNSPAASQDANGLTTIQDYLHYAAANNASLKEALEQWQAAAQEVPQTKKFIEPKITYDPHSEQEERQKVGVSQPLKLFGKREAEQGEAEAKAEAARLKYEGAKLRLFWEVKDAFYEYAYLTRAEEITREHLAMVERFEEAAEQWYGGIGTNCVEGILARMERFRLEDMLSELRWHKGIAGARLNAVINREETAKLSRPKREKVEPAKLNHTLIVDILRQRNPELAQLGKEIEAARNKVKLARARSYPDIGVGVDFIRTERAMSSGIRPDERDPVFFMFSVNLPLSQTSYEEAEQQAMTEVRKKEQEKIEAENIILAKAVRVIYDYEDSIREMRLYRDEVFAKAEESVRTLAKRYETWMQGFAGLLKAQRTLLSYQLRYERAMATNRQKLAEMEMLTGTKLD